MDIPRLSAKEHLILELLMLHGEMYGLQLVRASPAIKRGTVYVTLNRMIEKGFVEVARKVESKHEGGLARPLYRATGHGVRVFQGWELARAAMSGMETVG